MPQLAVHLREAMRVLVGKTFGIGNLVMSVPMLKAIRSLRPERLDLLVGTTQDDAGALNIAAALKLSRVIDNIVCDTALKGPLGTQSNVTTNYHYTHAVMAIPFDGRWKNRIHFSSDVVLDGRTRPDPATFGFSSWKKHEIEYQMDSARELGYDGETPSCSFLPSRNVSRVAKRVYLGLGYKKDAAGFWKFKHWGNKNYADVVCSLVDDGYEVVTTGDMSDYKETIVPICDTLKARGKNGALRAIPTMTLSNAFSVLETCAAYLGNDTGMMHVAASMDIPTVGVFMDPQLVTKNRPFTKDWSVVCGWLKPTTASVVEAVESFV